MYEHKIKIAWGLGILAGGCVVNDLNYLWAVTWVWVPQQLRSDYQQVGRPHVYTFYFVLVLPQCVSLNIYWRGRWKQSVRKEGALGQSSAMLSHHLVKIGRALQAMFDLVLQWGQFNNTQLVYKLRYINIKVKWGYVFIYNL